MELAILNCTLTIYLLLVGLVTPTKSEGPPAEKTSPTSYPVLSGVGVALADSEGAIRVAKVLPDSPAARSKAVHEGDQIVSVLNADETVIVEGKSLGDVVSLMRGPVGSQVMLELRPKGEEQNPYARRDSTRRCGEIVVSRIYRSAIS
jgi:hypothetical protein